jgi:phosphatidylglycerophosphatase A
MNSLALALSTWFGCGYFPKGPGTAGSLGGILAAILLTHLAGLQPWHFLLLAAAVTPIGIWAASRTAEIKATKDPQIVVIDEVLGQWIALAAVAPMNPYHLAAAFLLFRLFDIFKPWPVRQLESLPSGTGIIADDLMAGIYAAAVLALFRFMVQS